MQFTYAKIPALKLNDSALDVLEIRIKPVLKRILSYPQIATTMKIFILSIGREIMSIVLSF